MAELAASTLTTQKGLNAQRDHCGKAPRQGIHVTTVAPLSFVELFAL